MAKVKTKYMARVNVNGEVWEASVEYSIKDRWFGSECHRCKAVEYYMSPVKVEQKDGYTVTTVDPYDDRRRKCTEVKESTFRISQRKMNYYLSRADEWVHNALGKDLEIVWV